MELDIKKSSEGHVYVLVSPVSEHIKIGGTGYMPLKRIKEINSTELYKSHGPWSLYDFRQVTDWRKVEYSLHYTFRSKLVTSISGQKELFNVSPIVVSKHLDEIDESLIIKKPKVDRMFQDHDFSTFLGRLFRITTILNWIDLQGAWTFVLFPSTNGGRYYTLNIGTHEVAFSTNPSKGNQPSHMIHVDRMIYDIQGIGSWLKSRSGELVDDIYTSALDRSTTVFFHGSFETALEFLNLQGVRRAIIAYWTEALVNLQEKGKTSVHSRHHNWNAVAEIKKRIAADKL